jgi:hypothetical protein
MIFRGPGASAQAGTPALLALPPIPPPNLHKVRRPAGSLTCLHPPPARPRQNCCPPNPSPSISGPNVATSTKLPIVVPAPEPINGSEETPPVLFEPPILLPVFIFTRPRWTVISSSSNSPSETSLHLKGQLARILGHWITAPPIYFPGKRCLLVRLRRLFTLYSYPARGWLRRWWVWLLATLIILIVAYIGLIRPAKTTGRSTKSGAGPPVQSVPVTAVAAKIGDMPIYLTGLGSSRRCALSP